MLLPPFAKMLLSSAQRSLYRRNGHCICNSHRPFTNHNQNTCSKKKSLFLCDLCEKQTLCEKASVRNKHCAKNSPRETTIVRKTLREKQPLCEKLSARKKADGENLRQPLNHANLITSFCVKPSTGNSAISSPR